MSNSISNIKIVDIVAMIFASVSIIGYSSSNRLYILSALYVFWVICIIFSGFSFRRILNDKKIKFLIFNLIYAFFCGFIGGELLFSVKQFIGGVVLFSPIMLFIYYKDDTVRLPIILNVTILVWIITLFSAYVFYVANPSAARIIASDPEYYSNVAIGGGYSLAYGSVLLCLMTLHCLLKHKFHFWQRSFMILLVIMCYAVVIKTESTITFLSLLIGTVLLLMSRRGSSRSKEIFIGILVLIVFLLLKDAVGQLFISLSNEFEGEFGNRLSSFGSMLRGDEVGGEYSEGRMDIPLKSFKTFLENPIFGIAYMHGNYLLNPMQFGAGGHCELVDFFTNYGLIGGIPLALVYFLQIKNHNQTVIDVPIGYYFAFFVMMVFNPFRAFQSNLIFFFTVPAICQILYNNSIAHHTIIEGQVN